MSALLTKLRKAQDLLVARCVPKNLHYKPSGVQSAASAPAGANYHLIYPSYESRLDVSEQLYADFLDYAKPASRSVCTDYYLAEIPNGRLYAPCVASVAVITADNQLLADLSFNYRVDRVVPAEQNLVFKQMNFPDPTELQGTAFSLLTGGGGVSNYAHWLIDSLSRIHLLKKAGLFDAVDHFIVPSLKYDFHQDSLEAIGVDPGKIVVGSIGSHFQCERLLASTAPRGDSVIIPQWVTEFFREELLSDVSALPDFAAPYVYIRRSDSRIRNVLNETDLMAHLEAKGFKCYELSRLSFLEKVGLFARAKVVLSVHGAGLVNVMFCPTTSHFLELYPDQFVLTTYVDLAMNIGMDYSYLLCECSAEGQGAKDGQMVHVRADIAAIEEKLAAAGL